MILKIYLIEDSKNRRENISNFFKKINFFIYENVYNVKDDINEICNLFLEKGYDGIEIIPILPDNGQDKYSDYVFDETEDWVQSIEDILVNPEEKRIFLIDLSLNKDERACFGSDEDAFRAKTAKKIMNHISSKANTKECIIFTSTLNHLKNFGYSVLDMEKNERKQNISIQFISSNYFIKGQDEHEKTHAISITLQRIINSI